MSKKQNRKLPFFLAAPLGLAWVGLRLKPAPFPTVPKPQASPDTIPLPAGLPAPVESFYRVTYGDRIPVLTSAVVSGRGTMRLFGLTFPIPPRLSRFIHACRRSDCPGSRSQFLQIAEA